MEFMAANSQCISYKMDLMKGINGYNNLCDELLAEILLRLPTKSAFRLKLVCKRWYSLISSPHFIARFNHLRRHNHRDVDSSLVFQIRYYCDRTCNSGDCRKAHIEFKTISNNSSLLCNNNVYGFSLDYLPCSPTDLRLKGSFDDLILCEYITNPGEYYYYYVINLLTRQWMALPPSLPIGQGLFGSIAIGFLCSECKSVDCSHHNFMVVRLFIPDSRTPSSMFEVQIFSKEDGQWRALVVSSPLSLRGYAVHTGPLVAYRGVLHWLNDDCIVVYDPLNNPETFHRIIHLPIRSSPPCRDYSGFKLCVCQGHLRVVESWSEKGDHVLDVWELEDYDSGLWNLVHRVFYNNLIYDNSLPSVVCLHPENGDGVYMRTNGGIDLVNMKTRIVKRYYSVMKKATISFAGFHLADKWWPTPLSSLLH